MWRDLLAVQIIWSDRISSGAIAQHSKAACHEDTVARGSPAMSCACGRLDVAGSGSCGGGASDVTVMSNARSAFKSYINQLAAPAAVSHFPLTPPRHRAHCPPRRPVSQNDPQRPPRTPPHYHACAPPPQPRDERRTTVTALKKVRCRLQAGSARNSFRREPSLRTPWVANHRTRRGEHP